GWLRDVVWRVLAAEYDLSSAPGVLGVAVVAFTLLAGCIGLYAVVGHYAVDYIRWKRTLYVLTEDRVLIYSGLWRRQLESIPLLLIRSASIRPRGDGVGDLVLRLFEPESQQSGSPRRRRALEPVMIGIEDAGAVRAKLRSATRRAFDELGALR
ncbi:MAG: PH domain-containing protein, partial [Chloroflexota bacterium]|nr:PH domain-containing protein [Chloroflexota bacterium]